MHEESLKSYIFKVILKTSKLRYQPLFLIFGRKTNSRFTYFERIVLLEL